MTLTQKFTGHELDDGFDLTYAGARNYDQDLGVWTSADKARQYHSVYTYCGNNPVNCVDPDGNAGTGMMTGYQWGNAQFEQGFHNSFAPSLFGTVAVAGAGLLAAPGVAGAAMAGVDAAGWAAIRGFAGMAVAGVRGGQMAYQFAATSGIPAVTNMAAGASRLASTYWPEIGGGLFVGGAIADRHGVHAPISTFFQAAGEAAGGLGPVGPAVQFGGAMFDAGGAANRGLDSYRLDISGGQ